MTTTELQNQKPGEIVGRVRAAMPNLLDEARREAARFKAENDGLRAELTSLREAFDSADMSTPVVLHKGVVDEILIRVGRLEAGRDGGSVAPVISINAKRSGRPPNLALREYLKAGNYQREANHTIARKFKVSENTVRRGMWELGLKRDKQLRRRRAKVRA